MKEEIHNEKKKKPAELFDSTVNITPSVTKYFTIGILILVVVLVTWGIFGSMMVKMKASGLITSKLPIYTVNSDNAGIVDVIYKQRGDTVNNGDKLMKLSLIELNLQLKDQLFLLRQQIIVDSMQIETINNQKRMQLSLLNLQEDELRSSMKQTSYEIDFYQNIFDESELLFQKGIISTTYYNETLFQIQKLQLVLKDDSVQLISVINDKKTYIQEVELEKQQIESGILELEDQTDNLIAKRDTFSYVHASANGIIQECLTKPGMPIAQFESVFTMREFDSTDNNLYVDLFIAFSAMEKARVNMSARISPFNVDENRYGKIEATLIDVSDYPATEAYVFNLLGEIGVTQAFGNKGPVYYARAVLIKDSSTVSGLKWTSEKGPPIKINAGMACTVHIIVDYRPPISFVIPWIRKGLSYE